MVEVLMSRRAMRAVMECRRASGVTRDGRRRFADMPLVWADRTLRWIAKNSRPLSDVLDLRTVRAMLDALSTNIDGSKAASSVARQKRMVLSNSLNHAVEWEKLPRNPVPKVKWSAPKATRAVDRRSVPNPIQARTILNAVKEVQRSGPCLYAFSR
ncbi:hypothetical protein [Actinopolyspora halophila]|uniref:hypothetical protein n=1 Tax=Actinopolyspora halophila TaxID=1850 RepID=UPI001B7F9A07|nr:hypothetical protein [Actinopolyspora halophila]